MSKETEINALELLGADPDIRDLASLERLRLAAKVAPRVRNLTEKQRSRRVQKEGGGSTTVGEIVDAQLARSNIELDVWPLPARQQARVLARQGLTIREIAKLLGLSRPTVSRIVFAVIGRQRAPRGSVVRSPPHHASRERRAKFLSTPCAGGCGRLPPVSAYRSALSSKAWRCAKCAQGRARVRPVGPCAGYGVPCAATPKTNSAQPKDGPWRCRPCAARKAQAELSGESLARARSGFKNWWESLSEEQRQVERAKRSKPRKKSS